MQGTKRKGPMISYAGAVKGPNLSMPFIFLKASASDAFPVVPFKHQSDPFSGKYILPDLHDPFPAVDAELTDREILIPASLLRNDLNRAGPFPIRSVHRGITASVPSSP